MLKINKIAGVDEVGRGSLAGPVVAAAVILPKNYALKGLADSKTLSAKRREEFSLLIKKQALAWKIAFISSKKIILRPYTLFYIVKTL